MITPKPNPERFGISLEENMAFWLQIIPEYAHSEVRRDSLRLYQNSPIRMEDNA